MDDARRASERAAARGDGAAWWVARLRSGAISRADLELAAWVGDEDASRALGPSVLHTRRPAGGARANRTQLLLALDEQLHGLLRWGAPTFVRGCAALAAPGLDELARWTTLAATLRTAVEAWCRAPGPATQAPVSRLVQELHDRSLAEDETRGVTPAWALAVQVLHGASTEEGRVPGARGPRGSRGVSDLLEAWSTPAEASAALQETLLALARDGASLAWEERATAPVRACPAPDPAAAAEDQLAGLVPEELELAAWLGEPTARRLLGTSVHCRWPGTNGWSDDSFAVGFLEMADVVAWLRALGEWGVEWSARAHRALGSVAARRLEGRPSAHAKAIRLLEAARSETNLRRLRRLLEELALARGLIADSDGLHEPAQLVEEAVKLAVDGGASWTPTLWAEKTSRVCAILGAQLREVVESVRAELLPVLLGPGRPIRIRPRPAPPPD